MALPDLDLRRVDGDRQADHDAVHPARHLGQREKLCPVPVQGPADRAGRGDAGDSVLRQRMKFSWFGNCDFETTFDFVADSDLLGYRQLPDAAHAQETQYRFRPQSRQGA